MIYYLEYDNTIQYYFKQDLEIYNAVVNRLTQAGYKKNDMKHIIDLIRVILSVDYDIQDDFEFYILLLTTCIRYYLTIIKSDSYLNFDDLMKSLFRQSCDRKLICKNHSYTINESPYHERSENNYFELQTLDLTDDIKLVQYMHIVDATCYNDYDVQLYLEYNNKKYVIFDYDILYNNSKIQFEQPLPDYKKRFEQKSFNPYELDEEEQLKYFGGLEELEENEENE